MMSYFLKCNKLLKLITVPVSTRSCSRATRGLVLGVYSDKDKKLELTPSAAKFNSSINGKLLEQIKLAGNIIKEGESYVFWGLNSEFEAVAVVGLGKKCKGYDEIERLDQDRESVRLAATAGCKALKAAKCKEITVEDLGDAEAAAEGSTLSMWTFQEYKTKKKDPPSLCYYQIDENGRNEWNSGVLKANAQNFARRLADTPGNLMTPKIFACNIEEAFKDLDVQVEAHDRKWAEDKKMFSYLSVTNGSAQEPRFLELTYNGGTAGHAPYVLVGKGVTFDSGGISIKIANKMDEMRADMGGGAAVVAALHTLALLKHKANIKVLVPLCENLPSGTATKPGDVVIAMNGKSICVDNTDAEGRLILADALCYAATFKPKFIIDLATLTGAISIALGNAASGAYSNSNKLFKAFEKAGAVTGDRVWPMPLWKHYTKQVTSFPAYDVHNLGKALGGGSCTAAAFLKEFVPKNIDWVHLDIAAVEAPSTEIPYLTGMTGRPTRTLIEFLLTNAK